MFTILASILLRKNLPCLGINCLYITFDHNFLIKKNSIITHAYTHYFYLSILMNIETYQIA